MKMEDESANVDLDKLVNIDKTYLDYKNSLILTPEAVKNILDADAFDHDNYTHKKRRTRKNNSEDFK